MPMVGGLVFHNHMNIIEFHYFGTIRENFTVLMYHIILILLRNHILHNYNFLPEDYNHGY